MVALLATVTIVVSLVVISHQAELKRTMLVVFVLAELFNSPRQPTRHGGYRSCAPRNFSRQHCATW